MLCLLLLFFMLWSSYIGREGHMLVEYHTIFSFLHHKETANGEIFDSFFCYGYTPVQFVTLW